MSPNGYTMTKGRPRKAQINDVVVFDKVMFGVVVEYRDTHKWDRYHVIRTDKIGRNPYGDAIWLDSTEITATGKTGKRPGIVYRGNDRLGGDQIRGCRCNCCVHVRGVEDEPEE